MCFDCDGDGTAATQKATREPAKAEKARQEQWVAAFQLLEEVREANGGIDFPPRERRRLVFEFGESTFSTQDYADRAGLTKREAWIELCRSNRAFPVLDDAGKPVGWRAAYGR